MWMGRGTMAVWANRMFIQAEPPVLSTPVATPETQKTSTFERLAGSLIHESTFPITTTN
jgi:hypothetical protein